MAVAKIETPQLHILVCRTCHRQFAISTSVDTIHGQWVSVQCEKQLQQKLQLRAISTHTLNVSSKNTFAVLSIRPTMIYFPSGVNRTQFTSSFSCSVRACRSVSCCLSSTLRNSYCHKRTLLSCDALATQRPSGDWCKPVICKLQLFSNYKTSHSRTFGKLKRTTFKARC